MGAITKEMIECVYDEGIKVYESMVSKQEAKESIHEKTGMGLGSANDYITVLGALLDGVEYHRTINAFATEYFLVRIEKEFGGERRKRAALAVREHAKYYATLGHGHQRKIEALAEKYQ